MNKLLYSMLLYIVNILLGIFPWQRCAQNQETHQQTIPQSATKDGCIEVFGARVASESSLKAPEEILLNH